MEKNEVIFLGEGLIITSLSFHASRLEFQMNILLLTGEKILFIHLFILFLYLRRECSTYIYLLINKIYL